MCDDNFIGFIDASISTYQNKKNVYVMLSFL